MVVANDPPTYRYDPAQDESHRARLAVDDALKRAGGRVDPWSAAEERVAVPGSRYVDWLIPGLIGMGIMTNGLWAVAFPIVNARLRKLLKRLMASPMQRWEYLLAQMLGAPDLPRARSHAAAGVRQPCARHADRRVVWGHRAGGAGRARCRSRAMGLLLGSRARTIEAVSGLVNAFQLPMWLLSGVFFSSANFPERASAGDPRAAAHRAE